MITTYAAATAHEQGGWAGIIAIVVPLLIAFAGSKAYARWKSIQDGSSSPTKTQKSLPTAKPQLTAPADSDVEGQPPGGGEVVPLRPVKAVDEFVAQRIGSMPSTAIVNEATAKLRISPRTAWRAVREQRDKSGAA